ncbi:MAG TPA: DUF1830 domain-containing protein [Leptolyngbyaceae cyanobacterium]
MNQILASSEKALASEYSDRVLCFYINTTSRIQIIRITNIPHLFWERVVFPGQRVMFEAVTEAQLEINTSESGSTILSDIIPCQQLRLLET